MSDIEDDDPVEAMPVEEEGSDEEVCTYFPKGIHALVFLRYTYF